MVTVPEPPPPCERPDELIEDVFFTGYNIVSPPSNVDSTVSQSAACNAVAYLNTFGGTYINVVPTFLTIEYQGLYLGSGVFVTNGTTDCTTIPDGWYFTGASQSVNTVFQVIGGLIVYITSCTTTTTTSTSSTTTTSTSTSSTTSTTTTAPPTTTTTTTACIGTFTLVNNSDDLDISGMDAGGSSVVVTSGAFPSTPSTTINGKLSNVLTVPNVYAVDLLSVTSGVAGQTITIIDSLGNSQTQTIPVGTNNIIFNGIDFNCTTTVQIICNIAGMTTTTTTTATPTTTTTTTSSSTTTTTTTASPTTTTTTTTSLDCSLAGTAVEEEPPLP